MAADDHVAGVVGVTLAVAKRSAFAPLANPQLRLLLAGSLFANLAHWMQQFAVGWLVVQLAIRDGRPENASLYIGLVGLARFVPGLGLGLIAGIVADRIDRRDILLASRTGSAAATAMLALLVITDNVEMYGVMLFSAISTGMFVFDSPARTALLPHLVGRGTFVSAMNLVRASQHSSVLAGPLIGGLLIVPIGIGGTMAVNAVMYVVSLGAVLSLATIVSTDPHEPSGGALWSLREAFRYVYRAKAVLTLMVFLGAFAVLVQPYQQVLPAVAHDTLQVGAIELSWLISAAGVGALLGTVGVMAFAHVRRLGALITVDAVIVAGLLVVLGLQRELLPALVAAAALGATTVTFLNITSTLVQSHLPDGMRGRGQAIMVTLFQAGTPLGTLFLGIAGTIVGISNALIAAGFGLILVTALIVVRSPTHKIELGERLG